jgi:hypothetical protein
MRRLINKKTLLILGAGASMPYGLPSGEELWRRLCAMERDQQPEHVIQLFEACNFTVADLQEFARTFRRSGVKSIDIFLAHRVEFDPIGKLAIAYEIARCENAQEVHHTGNKDDWYSHLWHRRRTNVDVVAAIVNNRLRIVTFNYDRSLEYFLFQAIKNTYNTSDDAAQETLGALAIQHVYGLVGKFDHAGIRGGREYGPISRPEGLGTAAAEIRTIPETRADDQLFQKLRKWFEWAEEVCFLGFAFDEQNVQRLDFASVLAWKAEKRLAAPRIVACVYGMTHTEVTIAHRLICPSGNWETLGQPNLLFLRNLEVLQ